MIASALVIPGTGSATAAVFLSHAHAAAPAPRSTAISFVRPGSGAYATPARPAVVTAPPAAATTTRTDAPVGARSPTRTTKTPATAIGSVTPASRPLAPPTPASTAAPVGIALHCSQCILAPGTVFTLYADAPMYVWHTVPTSSNPSVVQLVASTSTTATYVAERPGKASIYVEVEDPTCWVEQPSTCPGGLPPPSVPAWGVSITVS